MSFDIFFQPIRFTGSPVEIQNPFTGEIQTRASNEPLNQTELDAGRQVVRQANARGPDEHGCCVVQFDDGGGADVFGEELETGCMAALRGITPDLLQFLFDLLKAGNWGMIPAMENTATIATSLSSLKGIPHGSPKAVVCNSAKELGVLLSDGVQEWEKHRDQIVNGGERH